MTNVRNRFTNVAFVAFAAVILLLSFFSFKKATEQATAADWVAHSQLVKLELTETFNFLVLAETSQRGYLLTQDSVFLQHFASYRDMVYRRLGGVGALVADNSEQLQNYRVTTSYFQKRIDWLQKTLDSFGKTEPKMIDSLLLHGQHITDTLYREVTRMSDFEEALLKQRLSIKEDEERSASVFILLFSVMSVLVLVFSFFRLKRESQRLNSSLELNEMLERKVRERTEELQRANDLLAKQNTNLQQQNEELNSFTFIANHDLKEPLRKIEVYCHRIIDQPNVHLTDKSREYLSKMQLCTIRMRKLLEAIFNYVQTDTKASFEDTDLNKVAALAVNTLQEQIEEKAAVVEYSNLPVVTAMPWQMEQLFTNLLANAIKYAKSNIPPHIRIEATELGNFWQISFSDNGIGFNEMYSQKIFEIFQRLHSRSEYEGTGIGLSICKKVVQNHGGTISVQSVKDVGSTFIVQLPKSIPGSKELPANHTH